MTTIYQGYQGNEEIGADDGSKAPRLHDYSAIAQEFKIWRQRLQDITSYMRQAPDLETLLRVTVTQIKDKLAGDRVLIYQFSSDESGSVVAESRTTGWTPALTENLPPILFGLYTRQDYIEAIAIENVNKIQLTPHQKQLLEKLQIKANLVIPISVDNSTWGLLVVHACNSPRQWEETEITLLSQISTELTYKLQDFKLRKELKQSVLAKQSVAKVISKILQQPDIEKIFQVTTQEVRQLLKCDRVGIYRFNADWSGQFVWEAVGNNWTKVVTPEFKMVWEDTHLQETQGGRYASGETFVVNDIYKVGHTPCHIDILEQIEVKAYVIAPIFSGEKLWGLLAAYQNISVREWQDWETSFLTQIGLQVGVALSQAEYLEQVRKQSEYLRQIAQQEKALTKIVNRIRQSFAVEEIFKATTQEVRLAINCDRVAVYQFNPDWGGEFVYESVASGWTKVVGPGIKTVWEDTYLQDTKGGRYAKGENHIVNDIYQIGLTPCHIEILEQFEAKAYIIVPVFLGEKLWGLLAAYQNSATREWQSWEVNFLEQIGLQFSLAKSQIEFLDQVQSKSEELAQIAEQEKAVNKITNRIRQSMDLTEIFRTATQELRQLLKCDRVAVYQFNSDWSGRFIAESVAGNWVKLVGPGINTVWEDTHLQETQGGRYAKGENFVVNDIYQMGHAQCHIEILEQFQVRAYVIVPIFYKDQLWGLLAAYQNSGVREWQNREINLLTQIGLQFSLAKSQIDYIEQVQSKTEQLTQIAEQEKTFTKVASRIRNTLDLKEIFRTTTQEIRSLLKCDRVAIYKFTSDWGGEFLAESVGGGWVKLVGNEELQVLNDPCLQEKQGGDYSKGDILVVNDLHKAGFDPCYVEILERHEAKAYIIGSIYFSNQLWGLLGVYQNSQPRKWDESEINLVSRFSDQLGLTLQQIEYLQQLESQSAKLSEAATREKAAKELLQQRSIQLLRAVRPALDGDLTVRAPITEDELGTIADAYNNTLQALRQIVLQVQAASEKIVETSNNSDASLSDLTNLAKHQSEEISVALEDIQMMVESTQDVVTNAKLVQMAVQKANTTVDAGDIAMNQTVNAIQAIRQTVAQTGKKIKRLSESSQKISKVVNLISNFATQTNVLALNAAIEATRAGEYGKGFAVVADEVRSLSRQSAAATIEIEKLVQEIQEETGEVAVAMELGIQQVVEGTNFVGETRQKLNDIVAVTAEIIQLIEHITAATHKQMAQSGTVTTSMNSVAAIAHKTFGESQEIATLLKELSRMAQDLLKTSGQFKVN